MLSGFILNTLSEIFWFLLYIELIPVEKLSVLSPGFLSWAVSASFVFRIL